MDRQRITANGKLHAPPVRSNLVQRQRLIELIDQAVEAKLIIVSAPAGFGKTTLLAAKTQSSDRVAWLSLDERDNDPSRFWLNVSQSLRAIDAGIGDDSVELFGSTRLNRLKDGVITLCNELSVISGSAVGQLHQLVIDDYHVIHNTTVHKTVIELIDHLPERWQLLVTTRSVPPFQIPALRARAQVCEIGREQLRFSTAETRQFFKKTEKLDLSNDSLTMISHRTEGWAAALQLLAVELTAVDDRDLFIRDFAGDSRLIADYFQTEVIASQPDAIQQFLVISAIPDRFCAPLVESLMEELPDLRHENAYEILEHLEQSNLFLVPQDQRRKWFRYHHLFRDLLRDRARRSFPGNLKMLQNKAAAWFEQNRCYEDAVQLMLQLQDYSGCERVIWSASQKYFPEGRFFKLREWLRLLPADCLGNSPRLVFLASLIAFNSGQPKVAKKWLTLVSRFASEKPKQFDKDPELAAELLGITLYAGAWVETNRNNSAASRATAPQIGELIRRLPNQSPGPVARLNFFQGEMLFQCGELEEARKVIARGIEACRDWGDGIFGGVLYTRMASTHRLAGELRLMTQVAGEGLSFVDSTRAAGRIEASGYVEQFIGEAHMERYQLDLANQILSRLSARSKRSEHFMLQVISGLSLVPVLRCRGQLAEAIRLSDEVFEVAAYHHIKTWFISGAGPTRVRLLLQDGDVDRAEEWVKLNELAPDNQFDHLQEFDYLALSRVLVSQAKIDTAISLLNRISLQSSVAGRLRITMEALILCSMAHYAKDDKDKAATLLDDALQIAAPENYIRMFLDEGPGLITQLREVPDTNENITFVRKVLDLAPSQRDHIKRLTLLGPEVLSKREVEVLRLIADGYSNRAVADRLFLSPHTIKAHTRNIYDKLAVSSRTQAVAKASSLGLISTKH